MSWQEATQKTSKAIHDAIPHRWRLNKGHVSGVNVLSVPETCGILSKKQIEITSQSATDLVQKLASKQLSSVAVVEAFCARTAIAHQLVTCLTSFFPQDALKRAAELDEYIRRYGKPIGPLHGLPIAIKDTYDLIGQATTYGYAANVDLIADRDSAVVKILRNAGAVFYCKTTMPQTGQALETVSPLFGRTLNPYNINFVAGGSSGGDAALVALRGAPMAPSTDIGGSIRAPAAFNGLYGIRPTADRIPKRGMRSVERGQSHIRVSCGPISNHIEDLELLTRILNAHSGAPFDHTSVPIKWQKVTKPSQKLAFGLLEFDGVVKPHPPIRRALELAASRLKAKGHQIIPVRVPFDCWESSQVAFNLYYLNGDEESAALLRQAGEELIPAIKKMLEIYPPVHLTAQQVLDRTQKITKYKEAFADYWQSTDSLTGTGRPIDGLLCPVSPSAGYPHDFIPWWGYTQLFNVLDYPGTVIPVKELKISQRSDPRDKSYQPRLDNPFDKEYKNLYDPELFKHQPVAIQLIARPFKDEELIGLTQVVDEVINGSPAMPHL